MTLSIWDTMAISGFIVLWILLLGIFFSIIGAVAKRSKEKKQKDEIYEKVMEAIKTDEDFGRIVRNLQKETDND